MLRNLLRDIYSNKKPPKNHLEAILVPLDSKNSLQKSHQIIPTSDLIQFGMEIVLNKDLFLNESENDQMCLFSALNPGKDVQFSEFTKSKVVSVYLKNVASTHPSQSSSSSSTLSIPQMREFIEGNAQASSSVISIYQQAIYSKLQIIKSLRENQYLMAHHQQQQVQSGIMNPPSHKTIIPSLFELIKNKPSLILHFKKEENSPQKQFYAIHINKELFNVIEQNPLDFQTSVTISSLKTSQIKIKSSNYLKLIDFFLQTEIEFLKSGQMSRRQSDKFDLHLISSQNKEIELEMQIFQYNDESNNQYFVFEGLKLKENCFSASSSLSSSSLQSRKDSNEIGIHAAIEPQIRKKKMNNQRQACSSTQNDEFNQKTLNLLENEHIHETSTRTSIDSSYRQQF